MSAPEQPYPDRERTFEAYGRHVNAGKVIGPAAWLLQGGSASPP